MDHTIPLNERHLKRVLSEYIRYYHEDRTHLGLGKGTPNGRSPAKASAHVLSHERLGGLPHRYDWAAGGKTLQKPGTRILYLSRCWTGGRVYRVLLHRTYAIRKDFWINSRVVCKSLQRGIKPFFGAAAILAKDTASILARGRVQLWIGHSTQAGPWRSLHIASDRLARRLSLPKTLCILKIIAFAKP